MTICDFVGVPPISDINKGADFIKRVVDEKGVVEGTLKSSELIISGNVSGKISSDSIVIMENGVLSGDILYKQIAVFEGGIINVAGMKQIENKQNKVVDILPKVAE